MVKITKVLMFHGFMVHDRHDLRHLKAYFDDNPIENVEFELVTLYDRRVYSSSKNKTIQKKMIEIINDYIEKDYDVVLMGYSFSCGVASAISKKVKLKGLIYFAPTISLFKSRLFPLHLKNALKAIKLRIKHGNKKADKIMEKTKTRGIIPLSYHIVGALLSNRKTYKNKTPYLAMRGNQDTACLDVDLKFISKVSKAKTKISITNFGEGWNHYFVYREDFFKDKIANEVKYFLERI